MDSLRVSMNSWGMDGKAQAEYEDLLVSSPVSPPGLSSSPPHVWPTSPLFPELDEYGRLGCSFEDDHTPFDEDEEGNVDDVDEEKTVTLGSEPPAQSDLTILVKDDKESEEDVPLAVTRAAKRDPSKVNAKSSNAKTKHKQTPKSSRRLTSKRNEVKPLPTRASRISPSPPDNEQRTIRSRTPSPAASMRSPSPALSDGSSYSTSLAARARPRRGATRRRSATESASTKGKRVRIYKPRTGPARQVQNKAAQKKYRDKVKDAAKATFRYAQTVRRAVGSTGNGRCRECRVCQKVRSATAALEEELDDIDPRHAELLRSEAVL